MYELNTVTYGTASAPFLAVRCLKQLGDENVVEYPRASKAILEDFYVDDFISGADTVEEANQLCAEVSSILRKGCFTLRKWISNNPDVLQSIQVSETCEFMRLGDKENTKMLGIYWSCQSDLLMYKIRELSLSKHITKRSILSDSSQIFDPLGMLNQVTFTETMVIESYMGRINS